MQVDHLTSVRLLLNSAVALSKATIKTSQLTTCFNRVEIKGSVSSYHLSEEYNNQL